MGIKPLLNTLGFWLFIAGIILLQLDFFSIYPIHPGWGFSTAFLGILIMALTEPVENW